ncbi:unnamed protein product [Enterobius vermicularis]|uniref:UBIQUITIN_CONJUGAT_2 domain-containing protein n=1 Tax=Enterobius vermicularis TaxID=51028 RepID=A0A0N4V5Z2_ENTVE|nr:unnamed protein product [Enterobius vermicularis]
MCQRSKRRRSRGRSVNDAEKRQKLIRKNLSTASSSSQGVGYGRGSTKSQWNISKTVEERLLKEEQLIWLLNALTAYIYHFTTPNYLHYMENQPVHLGPTVVKEIGESAVIELLEYHLNNDSVFDISEHMELYQTLFEAAAVMSMVPGLVPYLIYPKKRDSKSIAKNLAVRLYNTMASYEGAYRTQLGSPDFQLTQFITKIKLYVQAAHDYESNIPFENQVPSIAMCETPELHVVEEEKPVPSPPIPKEVFVEQASDVEQLYEKELKFFDENGELIVPFAFRKEAKNLNPFSETNKERTKRIAKELASMPNTLPLHASNSIYVCVDEARCDILKVLISGPDDTPYQNGLFEFDVFFPTNYPHSPPKCEFLTTADGKVRFNPNLYSDGKICLSVLGTWEGRPEEKWNQYCSLLQILISIQGLIFSKEPYYNEPGYEKHQKTEKGRTHSKKYNLQIEQATFLYAIMEQLERGPKYFQEVIKRHFWIKRQAIIDQAQQLIVKLREEYEEIEKSKKRGHAGSCATMSYRQLQTNIISNSKQIYRENSDKSEKNYTLKVHGRKNSVPE